MAGGGVIGVFGYLGTWVLSGVEESNEGWAERAQSGNLQRPNGGISGRVGCLAVSELPVFGG